LKDGENMEPLVLQKFVYIQLANKKQNIQSDQPAFKILGAAANDSDLQGFSAKERSQDIFKIPTHTLFPICKSRTKQLNAEYTKDVIQKRVETHMENKRKKDHCFYSRVYKSTDQNIDDLVKVASKIRNYSNRYSELVQEDVEEYKYAAVVVLDLGKQEVTMMDNSIVSTLFKRDTTLEPVMSVLALFVDMNRAESYCKHTASHQYPFCDVYIVEAKQWCSPYVMNKESMTEVYRNSRLDEIMTVRKEEMEKVREFEGINEIIVDNVT
jgi:hypothetical protein